MQTNCDWYKLNSYEKKKIAHAAHKLLISMLLMSKTVTSSFSQIVNIR